MFVAGAGGLIGAALVERLLRDGHELVLGVREGSAAAHRWPDLRQVRLDFAAGGDELALAEALAGVDVLVNAAGIFAPGTDGSFEAVHVNGPCSLFALARQAGVERLLQVSALGASAQAATPYWRSKAGGDDCARRCFGERATVVAPSLVFAPDGASSRLFLRLSLLPWLPLPGGGRQQVQPLHLDDLVDGLAGVLVHPSPPAWVAAVGPEPLNLADYLRTLGSALGHRPSILAVPAGLAMTAARGIARLPGAPPAADALAMLARGNVADPAPWQALLARPARPPSRFIAAGQAARLRRGAMLENLLPLLRLSVSVTWLVTAWVSAFVYPRADSLALLERAQVPAALAPSALYAAAALDALLGLAMWWPRWRRAAYRAQLALIAAYTAIISVWLPEYWAHPYGPLLKNIPMFALILALLLLEARGGLRRR